MNIPAYAVCPVLKIHLIVILVNTKQAIYNISRAIIGNDANAGANARFEESVNTTGTNAGAKDGRGKRIARNEYRRAKHKGLPSVYAQ